MNHVTVDALENDIRELEATVEGLAQERTELEDANRRLIDAIEVAAEHLSEISDLDPLSFPRFSILGILGRLRAALEAEGCGSTE